MRLMMLHEATVQLGRAGLKDSWQAPFPKTTKCVHCGGGARIGFVTKENQGEDSYVSDLRKNDPCGDGGLWPHDAVAVAVYFCKRCLEPTALYNQA